MIKGEVRMLKLEDFKTAKKRVDEVIEETHLIHSDAFSSECGNDVYIKPCLLYTSNWQQLNMHVMFVV